MPPNVKMCDDDNYQSDIKRVGLFKWLRDKLNQILRRKQDGRGRCFKVGSARVLKKMTRNVWGGAFFWGGAHEETRKVGGARCFFVGQYAEDDPQSEGGGVRSGYSYPEVSSSRSPRIVGVPPTVPIFI